MLRRGLLKILFVVVGVVCAVGLSGILWAQGNNEETFEYVKEIQQRYNAELMAREGVVGTAIGMDQRGRFEICILLERRGIEDLPQELDGVAVRLVVTGTFYARPKGGKKTDPTDRFMRPVPIGVSTGHPDVSAGTIGCRVTDGRKVYALSNNHIYADKNRAHRGEPVIQPGTYDGGASPADDIGRLVDFERIKWHDLTPTPPENTIDAAIAETTVLQVGNATPPDGYGVPKSDTLTASFNLPVKKYGRTTGLTTGKVTMLSVNVRVVYELSGYLAMAYFVDQILISPGSFASPSDSGSLIVCDGGRGRNANSWDDRKAVGLLFGGSDTHVIANPIRPVLSRFGVAIDGE